MIFRRSESNIIVCCACAIHPITITFEVINVGFIKKGTPFDIINYFQNAINNFNLHEGYRRLDMSKASVVGTASGG